MKLKDIFSIAYTNIRHRHLRSWLTILGIVIGVASIISLIGVSLGVSANINSRINTLGTNIITISPGGQQATRGGLSFRPSPGGGGFGFGGGGSQITFREADVLRVMPGVYKLDARLQKREPIQYVNQNSSANVIGTEPAAFPDSVGTPILYGRYLTTSDQYSAVIGFNIANETFQDFSVLNKQIKIDGTPFRVVGILNQSGGFGGTDSDIFIPQQTAERMFNESTDVSNIVVVVSPDHDTATVATELENELDSLHRVTTANEDFTITTAASEAAALAGITDVLSLFLGGIASISLLVGAIGVANTMFMSVLEQTRDIGVLKSLGAKNRDVVLLFLCEAAIIGFVGGFLGVALAYVLSSGLGALGLTSIIPIELVLGGLIFSVIVGIVAGISPAQNAARIPPVEALRYE